MFDEQRLYLDYIIHNYCIYIYTYICIDSIDVSLTYFVYLPHLPAFDASNQSVMCVIYGHASIGVAWFMSLSLTETRGKLHPEQEQLLYGLAFGPGASKVCCVGRTQWQRFCGRERLFPFLLLWRLPINHDRWSTAIHMGVSDNRGWNPPNHPMF